MIATYKLNTNDLSEKLIDIIRRSFPDKEIEISVMEADATEYLMSNPANEKHLNEAISRVERQEGLISVDPANLFH
jgi:hypothetical protein